MIFDKSEIAKELSCFHSLFRLFWDNGKVVFDKSLPTAWVEFDPKDGSFLNFCFNPYYYEKNDMYSRAFICAHEMLHILLKHGKRGLDYPDKSKLNKAFDLVVNHLLVDQFGFDRKRINFGEDYCWIDKCFDAQTYVERNRSFDYYYDLLDDDAGGKLVDHHTFQDIHDIIDDLTNKFVKSLSKDAADKLKDCKSSDLNSPAGIGEGYWGKVDLNYVKTKKKWESIIRRFELKTIKELDKLENRWDRINRRFNHILSGNRYFLPTETEIENIIYKKDKIQVFFFLDTSGSCWDLRNRFFKAARSLDPKKFDVRSFCFDTRVEEVDLKSGKVYGGGGTAFDIIEAKIQEIIQKENKKYPKAVFVMTDGYGSEVNPEKPERWHWFLSAHYVTYIPDKSKVYDLEDYE